MQLIVLSSTDIGRVRTKLREVANGWRLTRSLRLSLFEFSVLPKIEMLSSGERTVLCVKWLG